MPKENDKLLQDITLMMTDPDAAADDEKIENIMSNIRKLNPKKASNQLRLAACHFMTMYHTRKAMSMGMPEQQQQQMQMQMQMQPPAPENINLEQVEAFKQAQRKDMEMGWKFLDIEEDTNDNNSAHAARTARVLKIEIAQRLEDSARLKSAFDDLIRSQLSDEEILVAFTAAPFLGDWKQMMMLGSKIEKTAGGMEQLHLMSLQLPIPDFTLVYELAKEHDLKEQKAPDIDTLVWDLYNVEKVRVKFKDVECGEFEEKRKELLDEIQKQGDVNWEDVPSVSHVHIKRMGALCQAVSFGEMPMMLNGPWFDDQIHVLGRAEMPLMPEDQGAAMNPYMQSPESLTFLVQEEEWKLRKNAQNPNLFEGTYTLKQKPMLPHNQKLKPEHAPVNMTFDCEVYIGKSKKDKNNDDEKNDDTIENEENQNSKPLITEFDGLTLD